MHHIHYTVRPARRNCHRQISNVSELQKCKQPSIYNDRPCFCQGGTMFTSKHGHCFGAGPGQARNTYGHNWSTKQVPCMECTSGAEISKPTNIGSNIGSLPGSGRRMCDMTDGLEREFRARAEHDGPRPDDYNVVHTT